MLSQSVRIDDRGLQKLMREYPAQAEKALEKVGIQWLTWMNTGSPKENRTPPIRFGILRGSSSVFVGNKLVHVYPQHIEAGAEETPTPNKSHSAPSNVLTIGYNVHYAAKMHEWKGDWGKFTKQAGNAGNKWIDKHIDADKADIEKMLGIELKKGLGT